MKSAKDIMSTDVVSVQPETTVLELAKILTEKGINGVPVFDQDDELVGVVTENDLVFQKKRVHIPTVINILDSVIYLESPEKMKREMQKITGSQVKDIYTTPAVTVEEDTPLDEIATIMAEKNIHTLPVISAGKVVGIIGKGDIIRTLISE